MHNHYKDPADDIDVTDENDEMLGPMKMDLSSKDLSLLIYVHTKFSQTAGSSPPPYLSQNSKQ